MKINFGKFKGQNIIIGNNKKMRPTQSFAKSVIFDSLKIEYSTIVLDLFAGTGSLGFESASLGADSVYWIDNNIESFRSIKENIKKFNLNPKKFKAFKTDFRIALNKINQKIDLLFLDPPFVALKYYDEALEIIYKNSILNSKGVIVLEKPNNLNLDNINKFKIIKIKKFGYKEIIFLSNK